MKNLLYSSIIIFILVSCQNIAQKTKQVESDSIPKPTHAQIVWQEAELGMLVCYELHTFNEGRYNQQRARITPIKNVNQFNPAKLNTDQWIKSVKDAGATFAILTASHESGFRLWQSDVNPYSLKAIKWGDGNRDIVKEFFESCQKYGIKPGVYLGTRWNAQLGVYDFKVTKRSTISQGNYNRMIEKEVEEICTKYGDWFEFWFDGGAHGPEEGGPDVLSIVEKYQPKALFYHNIQRADARWGGSESGMVTYPCWATFPYQSTGAGESAHENILKDNFKLLKSGDPDGKYWMPAMSDAPLRGYNGRHEWFWEPGDEEHIYPLKNLMEMYYNSVGHNSTLIMGLTPDPDGLLPEPDVKRLKEWGDEINRIFSNPLGSTFGEGNYYELKLKQPTEINMIVLQEDIQHGERVRKFEIELYENGKWIDINSGSCIGHKRIIRVDPVTTDRVRLKINEFIDTPLIKKFEIYNSPK